MCPRPIMSHPRRMFLKLVLLAGGGVIYLPLLTVPHAPRIWYVAP